MKMSKLALTLAFLAALVASSPLLGLGAADHVEVSGFPVLVADTVQGADLESADLACRATPSQGLALFPVPAFLQPPAGCYSCQNHSDCRSYCGDYGACLPDQTYTCSLSSFDKFCVC